MSRLQTRYAEQHALMDALLVGDRRPDAVEALGTYYNEPASGRPEHGYSGRFFERYGLPQDPNYISPADVLSLQALSVDKLTPVAVAVEEHRVAISGLLARMPAPNVALHEVDHEVISRSSVAWQLYALLKTMGGKNRIVSANKLLARKRPHLLPPVDGDVRDLLGGPEVNVWDCYWSWLHADSSQLREGRLAAVRGFGELVQSCGHVSLVRRIDVVLWMEAQKSKSK